MVRSAVDVAGWATCFLSGGVWGMAFFSWGLPLPIPGRIGLTVLITLALAAASRAGRGAAAAFTLGMGVSSSLVLASTGSLFLEWWWLVSASALAAGTALTVAGLTDTARL